MKNLIVIASFFLAFSLSAQDSAVSALDTINIKTARLIGLTALLPDVDGMGIYASKKNEIINISKLNTNLATGIGRIAFASVAGLNVWENDGAGIQLSIGSRGIDPNRTSNFNTRQNFYNISADQLEKTRHARSQLEIDKLFSGAHIPIRDVELGKQHDGTRLQSFALLL